MQADGPGGATRPPLERAETAQAEGEASASAAPTDRCPRCAARIEAGHRFCPSCAYRLRPGDDPEPPPPRRSPWKRGFVLAAGFAIVLAGALLAVLLTRPSWLVGANAKQEPTTEPEGVGYAEPAITVADIPKNLVALEPWGYVMLYGVESLVLPKEEREQLTAMVEADETLEALPAVIDYRISFLRHEVTQGQYEEFLRDVEQHRERMPDVWVREQKGAKGPEDVFLWRHVPEPWILRDRDGEPVSWRVDPVQRNLPVTHVSYYDAWGFAEWAGHRLGMTFALPTELEWTRAARAGRPGVKPREPGGEILPWRWPWGAEPLVYACNNSQFWPDKGRPEYVHFVYSEPRGGGGGATPDGLLAMAGNVAEWAAEDDVRLEAQPIFGGPGYIARKDRPNTATAWAMGGSFRDGLDDCQVDSKKSYLKNDDRLSRRDDLGFRLVVR